MFPKKTVEGGFINPSWERFNRIMGALTAVLLICGLAAAVTALFSSGSL